MKKAIEILKEHKYSLDCLLRTDVVSHLLKQTNEAIKELEKLENRNCCNCKYSSIRFNIDCNLINKLDLPENFCCNKWENKA